MRKYIAGAVKALPVKVPPVEAPPVEAPPVEAPPVGLVDRRSPTGGARQEEPQQEEL